jgi:hypothetical protein
MKFGRRGSQATAHPRWRLEERHRGDRKPSQLNHIIPARFSNWLEGGSLAVCITILVVTASLKLLSISLRPSERLNEPNVIVPFVSEGTVLLAAAVVEYGLAAVLMFRRNRALRFGLLAWFSTVCVLYRYTLAAYGSTAACGCMGVWSPDHTMWTTAISLGALVILAAVGWLGSIALIARRCGWGCLAASPTYEPGQTC